MSGKAVRILLRGIVCGEAGAEAGREDVPEGGECQMEEGGHGAGTEGRFCAGEQLFEICEERVVGLFRAEAFARQFELLLVPGGDRLLHLDQPLSNAFGEFFFLEACEVVELHIQETLPGWELEEDVAAQFEFFQRLLEGLGGFPGHFCAEESECLECVGKIVQAEEFGAGGAGELEGLEVGAETIVVAGVEELLDADGLQASLYDKGGFHCEVISWGKLFEYLDGLAGFGVLVIGQSVANVQESLAFAGIIVGRTALAAPRKRGQQDHRKHKREAAEKNFYGNSVWQLANFLKCATLY